MKQANARQKKWMADIAEFVNENGLGVLYPGYSDDVNFELHHVLGRSAKHNKTQIGHEFIIPVPFELHNVMSNHPLNVTHHKKKFVAEYGMQCDLFNKLCTMMDDEGYMTPDLEICVTIMETGA